MHLLENWAALTYANELLLTVSFCLAVFAVRNGWAHLIFSLLLLALMLLTPLGIHIDRLAYFDLVSTHYRLVFGILATSLAAFMSIYAQYYFKGNSQSQKFFRLFAFFEWAVLVCIFADDIFLFFSGWELSALASYALIGFKASSPGAQRSASQALIVTAGGGLLLLLGLIFLAADRGTHSLSILTSPWTEFPSQANANLIFVAIALAAFCKSAQFPFSFWLPQAMVAPTPVSAYLHSASLVSLGVFLLGLFSPLLRTYLPWHILLTTVGLITFAWGNISAVFQFDLKRALACTTFASLGLAITLMGLTRETAISAGLIFLISHAVYKAPLFLLAGAIGRGTNTYDLRRFPFGFLSLKQNRCLFYLVLIASASMLSLPLTLGFIAKENILEIFTGPFAAVGAKYFSWIMLSLGILASNIFIIVFLIRNFLYEPQKALTEKFSFSRPLVYSCLPLVVLSLILGILPMSFAGNSPDGLSWGLFHRMELPAVLWSSSLLLLSFVIAFPLAENKKFWARSGPQFLAARAFDWLRLRALPALADRLTFNLEKSFSEWMLPVVFALVAVLIFTHLPRLTSFPHFQFFSDRDEIFSAAIFILGLSTLGIHFIRSLLSQIFFLSALGLGVAFCFAAFGAPDLVLSQILVEVVSLLLFLVAYSILVKRKNKTEVLIEPSNNNKILWLISASLSLAITLAYLSANNSLKVAKVASNYFFENSDRAGGSNLVNLIVVDFRALDTLVEISVLALAFFGSFIFLEKWKTRSIANSSSKNIGFSSLWFLQLARPLWILIFIAALILFFRGHHSPGGGFVGGVLAALALILRRLSSGQKSPMLQFTLGGLSMAYGVALLPVLWGSSFLESFSLGLAPSSLLFDLGVFFAVLGSVAGIFESLLSIHAHEREFN